MIETRITWRANNSQLDEIDQIVDFFLEARNQIPANEDLELVISCSIEEKKIMFQLAKLVEAEIQDPDAPYDAISTATLTLSGVKDRFHDDGTWERL